MQESLSPVPYIPGIVLGNPEINEHYLQQRTFTMQEQIILYGKSIDITLEVPERPVTDAVAYIIPGFGGIKATSDPLRNELAKRGIATVSYSPGRQGATFLSDLLRPQDLHTETIETVGQKVASNMTRYAKRLPAATGLDPFRKIMIPHSMGGLPVAQHAAEHPEFIEAIVNLAAAGYGSPKLGMLASDVPRGFIGGIWHELQPFSKQHSKSEARQLAAAVLHYYGSNLTRTLGEVQSCLTSDVRPLVKDLGVRTAYLAFKHDILIPPSEEAVLGVVDMYYQFDNMGHLGPQVKPAPIAKKIIEFALTEPTNNFRVAS